MNKPLTTNQLTFDSHLKQVSSKSCLSCEKIRTRNEQRSTCYLCYRTHIWKKYLLKAECCGKYSISKLRTDDAYVKYPDKLLINQLHWSISEFIKIKIECPSIFKNTFEANWKINVDNNDSNYNHLLELIDLVGMDIFFSVICGQFLYPNEIFGLLLLCKDINVLMKTYNDNNNQCLDRLLSDCKNGEKYWWGIRDMIHLFKKKESLYFSQLS